MKLFVSALEYSANIHLKYLLREMVARENIELCGIFDEKILSDLSGESNESNCKLHKISGESICNINKVAVMGFIDVIKRVRFFLTLRAKCLALAIECDKILLMDSSSFNIPLAKKIKARDLQKEIMYYILPQVWAWKPWRAKTIEANCDKLAAILPFEVECYAKKARFVGHPLLDEIKYFRYTESTHPLAPSAGEGESQSNPCDSTESRPLRGAKNRIQGCSSATADFLLEADKRGSPPKSEKRQLLARRGSGAGGAALLRKETSESKGQNDKSSVDCFDSHSKSCNDGFENNIITFMPGSRITEIKRIFPIFLQVKDELKRRDLATQFHLVIPRKFMGKNLAEIYGDLSDFIISFDTHTSLLKSKFAFICSGTATLECALIGTPFVLGYLARRIEAFVVKQFLNIRFVGLANILYNRINKSENFHDELLQENLTAKNLLDSYYRANPNDFLAKSLSLRKYLKNGSAKIVADLLLQE